MIEALCRILYDPQGILQALKGEAKMTPEVEEEFLGDLLDEARSLIGKAERALDEGDLETSLLWLRRGAMELAELLFYMELTGSTFGLGLDEPICLEIQDEAHVRVHGQGRAYILKRTGSLRFEARVLEPGEEIEMKGE